MGHFHNHLSLPSNWGETFSLLCFHHTDPTLFALPTESAIPSCMKKSYAPLLLSGQSQNPSTLFGRDCTSSTGHSIWILDRKQRVGLGQLSADSLHYHYADTLTNKFASIILAFQRISHHSSMTPITNKI